MPLYYALVDAMTGRETEVEAALRKEEKLLGTIRCKEKNADFLVKFEAPGFAAVDDVLQTYIRNIRGVVGVEVIVHWDEHDATVSAARKQLG